jgi:hypothetical protein
VKVLEKKFGDMPKQWGTKPQKKKQGHYKQKDLHKADLFVLKVTYPIVRKFIIQLGSLSLMNNLFQLHQLNQPKLKLTFQQIVCLCDCKLNFDTQD